MERESRFRERAFNRLAGLASVTIENGVTTIGRGAFMITGLTSITIPGSVTTIGEYVFYGCVKLATVMFEGNIASENFNTDNTYSTFPGDLRARYLAEGIGTYANNRNRWTKS